MREKLCRWVRESKAIWMFIFGTLFFLSIDFWNWDVENLVFDFLPVWLVRLILLQFILSGAILLFVKYHWSVEE